MGPACLVLLFVFLAIAMAACGDDDETTTVTVERSEAPESEDRTADEDEPDDDEDAGAPQSGPISQEEAEQLAVDAAGGGRATWSGREDERGAAWEVEVTRPDGSEVDVLLAADGAIVAQIPKLAAADANEGGGDGGGGGGGGGTVSRQQAQRAALAAVGEGSVTWSGREDDRGAAWEIEVTRPDGSEVDVLIAADGSVVD